MTLSVARTSVSKNGGCHLHAAVVAVAFEKTREIDGFQLPPHSRLWTSFADSFIVFETTMAKGATA